VTSNYPSREKEKTRFEGEKEEASTRSFACIGKKGKNKEEFL